jgi:hypothetical protein
MMHLLSNITLSKSCIWLLMSLLDCSNILQLLCNWMYASNFLIYLGSSMGTLQIPRFEVSLHTSTLVTTSVTRRSFKFLAYKSKVLPRPGGILYPLEPISLWICRNLPHLLLFLLALWKLSVKRSIVDSILLTTIIIFWLIGCSCTNS